MIEQMKNLEEQNKLMKAALADYHITPADLIQKQQLKKDILLNLMTSFNSGDMQQLCNYVSSCTSENCLLLTPSLFQELRGRTAVIHFWNLILEAFPDGLFTLSDTAVEENGFVSSKFTFSGTKVSSLPSDAMLDRWKLFVQTERAQKSNAIDRNANSEIEGMSKLDQFLLSQTRNSTNNSVNTASSSKLVDSTDSSNKAYPGKNSPFFNSLSSEPPPTTIDTKNKVLPTVNMSGYMAITLNSSNKINRYVFVWNSTSLIGQILGLSDGDLEAVSDYFNKSSKELSISK